MYTLFVNMVSETLSIRVRREIKRKMKEFKDVDWRREIESFIEMKIREKEVSKVLSKIDEALSRVQISEEPAWQAIRKFREER